MYRFVAFGWNNTDPAQSASADRLTRCLLSDTRDWQCVLDADGFRVFHALHPNGACHAYILNRGVGIVLGRIFVQSSHEDCDLTDPTFDDKETESIVQSCGRRMVEHYWGQYVLLLHEPNSNTVFVLRDPTGGLPCFLTKNAGLHVILSDVEYCVHLKLSPFSINWNHIIAFFIHNRLITESTGFREVSQLVAGQCAVINIGDEDCEASRSFYWDPARVYEADSIEEPDRARRILRHDIRYCVSAWASCYEGIVHELSGGIDSSIVAACLRQAHHPPKVTCFHFFTDLSTGDERPYAHAAAHSLHYELIETMVGVAQRTLEDQLNPQRVATPCLLGFLPESELAKQRLINDRQAGAVFSGQGGDHLLQHAKDALIAAEYVHRHGIRLPLLRIIAETSRLTNQSIWFIFGLVFRYGVCRQTFNPYTAFQTPAILSYDARRSICASTYMHPWVDMASRLPASKINQILDLVDCQLFYQRPCSYAEQIHPLISQPLIEHCLQIPTYILAHNGRARGLVREAFRGCLPEKIIERQSKGATTNYFNQLLIDNLSFLRDLLLDGMLIQEGLLDRRAMETELAERNLLRGIETRAVLNAVRAEAWLRTWRM